MAKCLVWLVAEYHRTDGDWVSLKNGPIFRGGDNAKLTYWHLTISSDDAPDLYKPTEIAVDFVAHKISLPKYAYVYDGKVLGFSREKVSIEDCVGKDFDFSSLGILPGTSYG